MSVCTYEIFNVFNESLGVYQSFSSPHLTHWVFVSEDASTSCKYLGYSSEQEMIEGKKKLSAQEILIVDDGILKRLDN